MFGPGRPVLLTEVRCNGIERDLSLCPNITIGGRSCDKTSSAGVICTKDFGVLLTALTEERA